MPSIETVLNKGFSNGTPWDANPWRRAVLLWVLPVCAVVIAVSGAFIVHDRLTAGYPAGYVVSAGEDCTLVVSARPGGPPVETVRQSTGGRFGSCGGLARNQQVYYDAGRGIEVPGPSDTQVGFFLFPVAALLAGVPSALAWTDTIRRRRRGWGG